MVKENQNQELISKLFDYLRFPLIVAVIFIHNYSSSEYMTTSDWSGFPISYWIQNLFSNILCRTAVPIFFFISGFLFFFKISDFNLKAYGNKLNKRFKTLLIPYLFWNLFFVLTTILLSYIPFFDSFFKIDDIDINPFNLFIGRYNQESDFAYPVAYQFWFIRDLIVCVLISPVLFWLISRLKMIWLLLLGAAWILNLRIPVIGIYGFSLDSIFFFSLGAYMSYHAIDFIRLVREIKIIALCYPICIIADLLTKNENYNVFIHNIGILIGILFIFLITADLLERGKLKPIPFLSSASFFVFAIHDPWLLRQLRKFVFRVFSPETDLTICLTYFTLVLIVTVIALAIYKILKLMLPSFLSIITGSR